MPNVSRFIQVGSPSEQAGMATCEERLKTLIADGKLANPDLFTLALVKAVDQLLSSAEVQGNLVSTWEEVVELFFKHHLAWKAHVQPDFVGVHPGNRSKFGVAGADSHVHGDKICQNGFSWKKASDATAIEADSQDIEEKQFNDELSALSDGLIPILAMIKILSVGGSHTNMFLRALKARSRTCVERLMDETGHLNPDKVCVNNKKMKEALDKGLEWTIVHRDAPKVWPNLVDFMQKSLNTDARGGQSEVEVMMSMYRMMQVAIDRQQQPDWKRITASACHSLPQCTPYVNVLAEFVQKNTAAGELLIELSKFRKAFAGEAAASASSKRILGSVFFSKVGAMNFGVGIKCPHVQIAHVKANLTSPKNKIVDNVCQLITSSHISIMTSKAVLPMTLQIDKIMTESRQLCKDISLRLDQCVKLIGMLDVRLVLHVLKLGKAGEGREFEDTAAIVKALHRYYVNMLSHPNVPSGFVIVVHSNVRSLLHNIAIMFAMYTNFEVLQHANTCIVCECLARRSWIKCPKTLAAQCQPHC